MLPTQVAYSVDGQYQVFQAVFGADKQWVLSDFNHMNCTHMLFCCQETWPCSLLMGSTSSHTSCVKLFIFPLVKCLALSPSTGVMCMCSFHKNTNSYKLWKLIGLYILISHISLLSFSVTESETCHLGADASHQRPWLFSWSEMEWKQPRH